MPAPIALSQIAQIAVTVKDLPRATAFYRDTLGMTLLFEAPPGLAFFDCAGVRLMLDKPEQKEFDHPASIIYYKVPDITTAAAALKSAGVAFDAEPHRIAQLATHDIWMAFFRDSEHNLLAITSEVPRT
ncbi:MAG TPA: VOC family protein [Gemmatimonadaceae bacterium]|jgi:predicted enzyme related to lactoylglutathione lyase|nr:VOC family protein [Gemmatimonadaceae bacterium]